MIVAYDRFSAVNYALDWALKRNPNYYDFESLGGDCTNFASQCVYAGAKTMNYTANLGWFYKNLNNRVPAWTGVDFFLKFLINNSGPGPFGKVVQLSDIDVGDVIFLGRNNLDFYHTVIVSKIEFDDVFICCHTRDARNKSLFEYSFQQIKPIHIIGVRK